MISSGSISIIFELLVLFVIILYYCILVLIF